MDKITVEGTKELQRFLKKVQKIAPQKVEALLFQGAANTQETAVKSIQASGSAGNVYTRGNVTHTASAPNNPPNSDTGNLVANITVKKIKGGYDVGSRKGAPYGAWLEFGTTRMERRPWLGPSFQRAVNVLLQKLRDVKVLNV